MLVGDLPDGMDLSQPLVLTWLCVALADHLTSIATTEWAGEFVRGIAEHEERLLALTGARGSGLVRGCLPTLRGANHVVPGLRWVTCEGCGATTYARDHLDKVLDEARGWVAPSKRMAEAIVALVDTEQSVPRLDARIRQWGQRGKLVVHRAVDEDGDEVGPRRYWFGEVLDRLTAEGSTRPADDEEVADAS